MSSINPHHSQIHENNHRRSSSRRTGMRSKSRRFDHFQEHGRSRRHGGSRGSRRRNRVNQQMGRMTHQQSQLLRPQNQRSPQAFNMHGISQQINSLLDQFLGGQSLESLFQGLQDQGNAGSLSSLLESFDFGQLNQLLQQNEAGIAVEDIQQLLGFNASASNNISMPVEPNNGAGSNPVATNTGIESLLQGIDPAQLNALLQNFSLMIWRRC